MIEGYDDIVKQWTAPSVGHGCCNTVTISPAEELNRWAVQQTITLLANSDYYYTKAEVDSLLRQITADAVTREEVERMINAAIQDKADKSEVEALAQSVYTKEQTNSLLALYLTKAEANGMFANYSKVENTTLVLNADNITN